MASATDWLPMVAERRWALRLGGVRIRATLAATLVVALALALAAVAFLVLQRRQLEASLTDLARQKAVDVARQVAQEGAATDLAGGAGEQSLVQVVDSAGRVVASSPSVVGEPPVVRLTPLPGRVLTVHRDRLPIGEDEPFVLVARGTPSPDGVMVVIVGQSLESVQRSSAVVGGLLAVGYPAILALVAGTSYWLTGRALAPVEAIRRRVATIGATDLSARVPVPAGGDEITALAETMNLMLSRLQRAIDTQRRFVADASHELRSPLTTIRAAHEIATVHPEVTDWASTTRDVVLELDRLDRLVADMLLLARADEHGLSLQVREVDLDDLVRAETSRLRRAGVPVVDAPTPPVRVLGDTHHLARLLRNLTDNAARHSHDRVEIRLHADSTTATVEVIDDGPGIPLADREQVFERFVRLDESRTRDSGGAGLGLPIAREIARVHGGELVVAETPLGTRLVLTLPVTVTKESGCTHGKVAPWE